MMTAASLHPRLELRIESVLGHVLPPRATEFAVSGRTNGRTATFPELAAALTRGHAALHASQVHALLLGGLSSTLPDFSPVLLLRHIFGEGEPTDGDLSAFGSFADS